MFLSIVFIFTVVNIQKLESSIFAFVDTEEIQVIFIKKKKKKRNIYLYMFSYRSTCTAYYSKCLTIVRQVNRILNNNQNNVLPAVSFHLREIKATE